MRIRARNGSSHRFWHYLFWISNFKLDPLKIHANQAWNAGGRQLLSLKTPTCLLHNEQKQLVSFGYEAENAYAEILITSLGSSSSSSFYISRQERTQSFQ
jgi:hypothetical protein